MNSLLWKKKTIKGKITRRQRKHIFSCQRGWPTTELLQSEVRMKYSMASNQQLLEALLWTVLSKFKFTNSPCVTASSCLPHIVIRRFMVTDYLFFFSPPVSSQSSYFLSPLFHFLFFLFLFTSFLHWFSSLFISFSSSFLSFNFLCGLSSTTFLINTVQTSTSLNQ